MDSSRDILSEFNLLIRSGSRSPKLACTVDEVLAGHYRASVYLFNGSVKHDFPRGSCSEDLQPAASVWCYLLGTEERPEFMLERADTDFVADYREKKIGVLERYREAFGH